MKNNIYTKDKFEWIFLIMAILMLLAEIVMIMTKKG